MLGRCLLLAALFAGCVTGRAAGNHGFDTSSEIFGSASRSLLQSEPQTTAAGCSCLAEPWFAEEGQLVGAGRCLDADNGNAGQVIKQRCC
jgi:hypothetical protein